jgi:hypothetical protein
MATTVATIIRRVCMALYSTALAMTKTSGFLTLSIALLMVLLPMPFGGVPRWSHTTLQLVVFALLVASLVQGEEDGWRRVRRPALGLAALGLYGVLQSFAWPSAVVGLVSPEHLRVAELVGEQPGSAALSLAPGASRFYGLTWIGLGALIVVASRLPRRPSARVMLLGGAIASLSFQVLYGARMWLSRTGTIWGLDRGSADRFRGTFINPDHFALYMEIMLAVLLAWAWWSIRRAGWMRTWDRRILLIAPPVIAWLTAFTVLAFSGSRAGLLAAIMATVAQGLILAMRQRRLHVGAAGILAPALGLVAVAWIGLQAGLGRWFGTSAAELTWNARHDAWLAGLELWQLFPVTGVGMAAFREGFPLVQPVGLDGAWLHIHNDWLEIVITLGIVGALLFVWAIGSLLLALGGAMADAERSLDQAVLLAAMGAVTATMVHSLLDFGLTMPANAALLCILCGLALSLPPGRDAA